MSDRVIRVPGQPATLAGALRDGPFSTALHAAIEASGLSLDSVRRRLLAQGDRVSLTTLSYWRSGRSRPEREASLRAVSTLEEILAVPPRSLLRLLETDAGRGGRLVEEPVLTSADLFEQPDAVDAVLADLELPLDDGLSRLSTHDLITLDSDRRESRTRTRQVLRADSARINRCLIISVVDDPGRGLPEFTDVAYCRVGRVRGDQSAGILAAELILDGVLGPGDTTIVEYELGLSRGEASTGWHRAHGRHLRDYVLQVRFAPDALPVYCYSWRKDTRDQPAYQVQRLWISASDTVHLVGANLPPGLTGISWEWD